MEWEEVFIHNNISWFLTPYLMVILKTSPTTICACLFVSLLLFPFENIPPPWFWYDTTSSYIIVKNSDLYLSNNDAPLNALLLCKCKLLTRLLKSLILAMAPDTSRSIFFENSGWSFHSYFLPVTMRPTVLQVLATQDQRIQILNYWKDWKAVLHDLHTIISIFIWVHWK